MAEPVSQAEFETWLTPVQVADALPHLTQPTMRSAVAERLEAGIILAVAERADIGGQLRPLFEIPKRAWVGWASKGDHKFWESGQTDFPKPDSTGYGRRRGTIRAFGVRLDPEGVRAFARYISPEKGEPISDRSPVEERTPIHQNPSLTKPSRIELRAWVAWFGNNNPDATFGVILLNAKLHFPNRQVTERPLKDAIAELGLTKKRGNPAIKRK